MGAIELQTAFFFFVLFPISVYLWSSALVQGPDLKRLADAVGVGLAARMMGAKRGESDFAPTAFLGPVLLVALFNLTVAYAFVGPHGPAAKAVVLAYVGVHLLWLRWIGRAIKQAR